MEGKAIWQDTQPVGVAESCKEAKLIADAHNAALAVERERLEKQWGREGIHVTLERLKRELAAEREKHRKEMEAVTMNTSDIETVQQLLSQLAAAQAANRYALIALDKIVFDENSLLCEVNTALLNVTDTTALDAAIAEAVDKERSRWNEVFEAEVVKETERVVAEAQQPLVELLEQVLQETVDARDYPDGPCLNADTRTEIKILLAKVKEWK